jgi:N-acetylmuramoyl-L-alanine amidase
MGSKKVLSLILLMIFLIGATTANLAYGDINIRLYINGVAENKLDTDPFILNGRVMVPVRFVSESLGYQVEWKAETKEVVMMKNEKIMILQLESKVVRNNFMGDLMMDVAPVIKNDRTMVPLRFIAESMGVSVLWNENTRSVFLRKSR